MPEQDAVLVVTSGVRDMQAVLNIAWDKMLPAFKSTSSLAPEEAARQKLEQRLKGLKVRTVERSGSAPEGVVGKTFQFRDNERKLESIRLEGSDEDGALTLVARIGGTERRITCGRATSVKGRAAWGRLAEQPMAASGAWTGDDTFTARMCFYETPFVATVRLKVTGDELHYAFETNVGFGPTRDPPLVGKARPQETSK